ncbi:tetratricopeptide repeat protein [Niabella pedocola]|uniref:Tetratricopeptide repeat protein n=1 Tax=Niabella pedocola TaxID=1752077 RepID=A0ABS8PRR3_9BACT|nr:tetratricopeptide repeat protein [Niabella pedocola]MCD2423776.1 tetratricopeptide repeat protein [Niabella pedocola]
MKLLFCLCLIAICPPSAAQDTDIIPYLEAWKVSNRSQSYRAQVFFDSLRIHKSEIIYRKKYLDHIAKLRQYLQHNPNRRLEVRLMMFEIMAGREYQIENRYYTTIDEAIKKAYPLRDDQLNAELYSIRADIPPAPETHLLYNLKAIEIQRRIGFEHFPYVQNRFFGVSYVLYGQGDYIQAIAYGRQCLKKWELDTAHRDPRVFIFQCDILGAAYKKLNQFDSVRKYYNRILQALNQEPDQKVASLWRGIALGNIGQTYTKELRFSEALPLLTEYLQNSLAYPDSLNIAMAQNAFASFYFQQKRYDQALLAARQAWQIANRQHIYAELTTSADLLSAICRQTGQADSAFYYHERSDSFKEITRERIKKRELSVVNAQIAFDNLRYSLVLTQSLANKEKSIRNAVLAGIVLLTVIALLLYNRKRVKDQYQMRVMALKHDAAKRDIQEAREKISVFTNNLIEKNELIRNLEQQLANTRPAGSEISEQLLNYPLLTEEGWEQFRKAFTKVYPAFFNNLRRNIDNLTPAMERLAALVFLQLTNYQIANTLGISKDSVARSKRRLRTGLTLAAEQSLEDYIGTLA